MLGLQLGLHNWRILTEDGKVDLSNKVAFDKTLYPGISTPDPAGLITPLLELVKLFEETNVEPREPVVHDIEDSSDNGNKSFKRNLFPASDTHQPPCLLLADGCLGEASMCAPHPGFDMFLQPFNQKALKDISSNIDEGNILDIFCQAHLANANDEFDFHVQFFLAGAQFFDQTAKVPKSYSKAMKFPNCENWKGSIELELAAMARLDVWLVVDIPLVESLLSTVWVFQCKFNEKGKLSKYKA